MQACVTVNLNTEVMTAGTLPGCVIAAMTLPPAGSQQQSVLTANTQTSVC